ncbi:acidic proline-rich protein PRP25-like [Penaeus monodon]|uniref:acidic proline-rich protein PRP25-like n=1 Tax=Penaeus monodon TaxID=6687 RepID=UPI0018A6E2B2|nr:acidic proline-rich protein PRP25-like [Penaeus monodon]
MSPFGTRTGPANTPKQPLSTPQRPPRPRGGLKLNPFPDPSPKNRPKSGPKRPRGEKDSEGESGPPRVPTFKGFPQNPKGYGSFPMSKKKDPIGKPEPERTPVTTLFGV